MSYMRQRVLTHDRWLFLGCSDVPVPIRSGFVHRYFVYTLYTTSFSIDSSLFIGTNQKNQNKLKESNT